MPRTASREDSDEFRQRKISASDLDLGSRAVLENEPELIWYPAEVNTSIRPGWFYHAEEDGQVKPLEQLVSIYENAAGGNATFLLNIPRIPTACCTKRTLRGCGSSAGICGKRTPSTC